MNAPEAQTENVRKRKQRSVISCICCFDISTFDRDTFDDSLHIFVIFVFEALEVMVHHFNLIDKQNTCMNEDLQYVKTATAHIASTVNSIWMSCAKNGRRYLRRMQF